jgi:hypothetical protein
MLSVVHLSDCPKLEFIQPHCCFVIREGYGRLLVGTPRCGVRLICGEIIHSRESDAAARRPYL